AEGLLENQPGGLLLLGGHGLSPFGEGFGGAGFSLTVGALASTIWSSDNCVRRTLIPIWRRRFRMSDAQQPVADGPSQASGWSQLVTLIRVMVVGGAGAKLGGWLAGPVGFWVVGSLAGIAVAVTSALVTKTFWPGNWAFYVLGPIGCLAGVQLSQV